MGERTGAHACPAGCLWLSIPRGLGVCCLPLSFPPRSPWLHGKPIVCWASSQARSVLDGATSPLSWNSRSKNKIDSLFTPQLFPASFSGSPYGIVFLRNYEAMKRLNNSNTMHRLFIKKTIIENDPENSPSENLSVGSRGRKWPWGGSGFPPNSPLDRGWGGAPRGSHVYTARDGGCPAVCVGLF